MTYQLHSRLKPSCGEPGRQSDVPTRRSQVLHGAKSGDRPGSKKPKRKLSHLEAILLLKFPNKSHCLEREFPLLLHEAWCYEKPFLFPTA